MNDLNLHYWAPDFDIIKTPKFDMDQEWTFPDRKVTQTHEA